MNIVCYQCMYIVLHSFAVWVKINKKEVVMTIFGVKIKELREKVGLSQRQLAFKVDITPTYMSKIERGEFNAPSETVIKELAKVLNEDVDILLSYADKVDNELLAIIKSDPKQFASMLRERAKKKNEN